MKNTEDKNKGNRLILPSFGFLLLLCVFYFGYLQLTPAPKNPTQTQWESNVTVVQNFLYSQKQPQGVMVGSSMSRRLQPVHLPDSIFNLSCLGGKPAALIKIIRKSGKIPHTVFIEANSLGPEDDPALIEYIFNPILQPVRGHIVLLRDENKPFSRLFGPTLMNAGRVLTGREQKVTPRPRVAGNIKKSAAYQAILNDANRKYGDSIPEEKMASTWNRIRPELKWLKENNINIVFYFVPVGAFTCLGVQQEQKENLLKKHQAEFGYKVIPMPDCADYNTTDGVHLEDESAIKYTQYFKSKLAGL